MSSKLSLAFRKAAQRDVPALAEVYETSFADKNEVTRLHDYLTWTVNDSARRVIIAETPEHKIAGFVIAAFNSETMRNAVNVDQLAVAPDAQGKGVGRALLREVETTALKNEFEHVTLHVRAGNDKAIGLYDSEGFRPMGMIGKHYKDGESAIPMKKHLMPVEIKGMHLPRFIRRWTNSYV